MEKQLKWHQIGPEGFFTTNPDLADIFSRTDLHFEKFHVPDLLGFLISKFMDFQTPRCPGCQP